MKIADWITNSSRLLQSSGIDSARLDCLILLETVLGYTRIAVLTRQEEVIPDEKLEVLQNFIFRRQKREPIAYIVGMKDFYGRDFKVNGHVLVPRPESEAIIEEVLALNLNDNVRIADVGTGSGILAITLALELPDAHVYAYDVTAEALEVAKVNNSLLHADVHFDKRNLLEDVDSVFNVIVANLPYVSDTQFVSPETAFEPKIALFANNDGLELINKLIVQIHERSLLHQNGYLLLESEPRQHERIHTYAKSHGLVLRNTHGFVQTFQFEG